ncbi:MAG: metallophosphoesterase [Oscillospiraceae bacterium]|nr:metallophosphoesterase [Oscillospiraceae bacterium]
MKKMIIIPLTIAIIVIAIVVAAFWSGFVVRRHSVSTDKFESGQSVRAVLISDLHSQVHGDDQSPLIRRVAAQNPDIILLAGDMYDDVAPRLGIELFLDGIRDVAPIFYVTGNHEYWTRDIEAVKELFRSFGVTVLEDEYVEVVINDIPLIIAGVCDPECSMFGNRGGRTRLQQALYGFTAGDSYDLAIMQQAFGGLSADYGRFKILVAHRPERIDEYKQFPFDLAVSGHAHGGQVRIPFLINGIFAPNQGFFPPYAGGRYDHGSLTHIVSRGATTNHPRLPRIFNPPEIVVIDIIGD